MATETIAETSNRLYTELEPVRDVVSREWTQEQKDLIKRTVAANTTDDEFAMFLHFCQQSGLDPLRKQAHCIVRQGKTRQATFMTGIDGFRARAESFPDFLGCSSAVVFEGDDFSINYGKMEVEHIARFPRKSKAPLGAWAIVRRLQRTPYIHWLTWPEIFDTNSFMHKRMPEVMAKKTVEAQALRHEYPEPFSGIYDPSEIPAEGESILNALVDGNGTERKPETARVVDITSAITVETQPSPQRDAMDDRQDEHEQPTGTDENGSTDYPDKLLDSEGQPNGDAPTDAQVERWVDLTDWAEEVGMMTEAVHKEAIEWVTNKSKRAVGVKIGQWKKRKDRHDAEWGTMDQFISDCDADDDDKLEAEARMKSWVMNPKTLIEGKTNNPDSIVAWLTSRQHLDL